MRSLRNYGWFMVIGLGLCYAVRVDAAARPKPKAKPAPSAPQREVTSNSGSLGTQIQRLATSPRVGGMQVGIRIELLGEHPTLIYEQKSDQAFKPASNQKIVTSGAALMLLPPDFTYRTILAQRGQDLVVIGAGDPAIGDPPMANRAKQPPLAIFHTWAEALKARGITKVAGDLVFDDFIFEQNRVHPGWAKQFNLQLWYCAPAGGLNINDNCVEVVVKPAAKMGEPAEASIYPPNDYLKLENRTRTSSKGEPIISLSTKNPTVMLATGPVSRGNRAEDAPSVAISDPGMLFASACRTALIAEGIDIAGTIKRERVRGDDLSIPRDLQTIATHEQKLSELMWRVDKSSLNMFAEAVLKTLGAYDPSGRPVAVGGYESGRAAIQRFLDKLGVNTEGTVIDDGSGLSHGNRVTANELVAILRAMNNSPRREEWWSNLAVPGEKEGTLRRRLKGYQGKVYAKTGSIGGVSALSGYVKAADDRIYAFSILCNDTNKAKSSPHELQDAICKLLASH